MKFWIILNIFCFLKTFASCEIENNDKAEEKPRVVGGKTCPKSQNTKFIVAITGASLQPSCGGSLVSPRYVLTAAHCLPIAKYVRGGITTSDLKAKSFVGIIRKVIRNYQHEHYNRKIYINDIAMLVLDKPLMRNPYIDYVQLPNYHNNSEMKDICPKVLVMGWGLLNYGRTETPSRLQCVMLDVITWEECQRLYFETRLGKVICTLSSGKDACLGDSGGPLMCGEVLVGIVSWGRECATANNPGVFTKVDEYLDFIYDVMEIDARAFASRTLTNNMRMTQFLLILLLNNYILSN